MLVYILRVFFFDSLCVVVIRNIWELQAELLLRILVSIKFELELFYGKYNFNLWQSTVKDILGHKNWLRRCMESQSSQTDDKWEDIEMKGEKTISSCNHVFPLR